MQYDAGLGDVAAAAWHAGKSPAGGLEAGI